MKDFPKLSGSAFWVACLLTLIGNPEFPGISQHVLGEHFCLDALNAMSGEKKTNKHKQLRGIVPEMGGGQIVYVFPFFRGKKGST